MGTPAGRSAPPSGTAFRFAFRELRGGLRGFYVFLACIALGVATIAGVDSVARTMAEAIAKEGKAILGGDLSFNLIQRQASPEERGFLTGKGTVSEIADLRAMARRPDGSDQSLVEMKAVDGLYPLYDTLAVREGGTLQEKLAEAGGLGAVADEALYVRLDLKAGDTIKVGDATFTLTGTIDSEPDRLSDGADFGPRLMVSRAALEATGLVQPGSLTRWLYRVRLAGDTSDAAVEAAVEEAKTAFPQAGWRIVTRENASPGLEQNIQRLAQFLTLIGLSALIVGGVGVANSVRAFLDAKRDVIATFKCLGAPAGFVVRIYLLQIVALAVLGILIGLALGATIPFAAAAALKGVLPIAAEPRIYPLELALAAAYGLATALAFALWPLGRARQVPATALFRDAVAPRRTLPGKAYLVMTAAAVGVLVGLSIGFAHDRRIAVVFAVAAGASFVLLRLVAAAIMALAKRAPRVRRTGLRLALANIHRPGALTPSVVLSLGLGLALLATLTQVDANLRRELTATIPETAPSFFFLDVQNASLPAFKELLAHEAPGAAVEDVPMLRGRLVMVAGQKPEEVKAEPDARWVLSGDRGITYSATTPKNARIVEGEWWPENYEGQPLVSLAADIGRGLHLRLGDTIRVNVLGREVEAKIANFREVQWERLAINFVLVFSPNAFRGAPHSHLATVTFPGGASTARELRLLKTVTNAFPAVSAIRVKEALDRVNDLLAQISWAILAASSITLVTAILVLGGALAAANHRRLHDAVVLKTLGATRAKLLTAFGIEYLLLGAATAIFGLMAGAGAASYVLKEFMRTDFAFEPGVAVATVLGAIGLTVGFGLIGTWRILGRKAAPVLRNL